MSDVVPTRRLQVQNPEAAVEEIRTYLEKLAANGERAWCEVIYPPPGHADPDTWAAAQEATFDAVELIDGEIVTLPPYNEMRGD